MVQFSKNFRKNLAFDLRKKGLSYSEIKNSVPVAKSTLAYWFRDLKLSETQTQKLDERRLKIARENIGKRNQKILEKIEDIKLSSAQDIKEISKREFWLMGLMLYWRQRNSRDFKSGVNVTSSDPKVIKFFLRWLSEIGRLEKKEIFFDILINNYGEANTSEAINYWARLVGYSRAHFRRVYFLSPRKKGEGLGALRLRVRGSSMLARQIAGWHYGIEKSIGIIT